MLIMNISTHQDMGEPISHWTLASKVHYAANLGLKGLISPV
jgi:hypothetical protein